MNSIVAATLGAILGIFAVVRFAPAADFFTMGEVFAIAFLAMFVPGMIIGTTDLLSPIGLPIRITTAGWQNALNPRIATHIAIVCKEHDLFYFMEMALPKIREADCNEYEHGILGDHVVFAAMPFAADDLSMQNQANNFLLESHRIGIKYGTEELFKFWDIPVHPDKKKLICSELSRNMCRQLNIPYPKEWDTLVSPYDEQKFYTSENKLINIGKL